MAKKFWESEYAYQRILEILDDYWLTEPDEFRVRVQLDFIKANGETQQKCITWQNPDYCSTSEDEYPKVMNAADILNDDEDNSFWNYGEIRRKDR